MAGTGARLYFCSGGSGYFTAAPEVLEDQLAAEVARLRQKIQKPEPQPIFRLIPTPMLLPPRLKDLYERALRCSICGLSIGTRPDALKAETMDYLKIKRAYAAHGRTGTADDPRAHSPHHQPRL